MSAAELFEQGDHVIVTFRDPVLVLLQDVPTWLCAIDADVGECDDRVTAFRCRRLLKREVITVPDSKTRDYVKREIVAFVTMKVNIAIAHTNIAGVVIVPNPTGAPKP